MTHHQQTALYPGTFDPLTLGHLDIIERAAALFGRVIVAIASSDKKKPLFSLDDRVSLCQQACEHLPNVTVITFSGLMVHLAKEQQATVVVRGIRTASDFDYEHQLVNMNYDMYPELETVFLTTRPALNHISSSLVREISAMGGLYQQFVPEVVAQALARKLA